MNHFDSLSDDVRTEQLRNMLIIRRCEEAINRMNKDGVFHGTNHLCMGQEASNIGLCLALEDEDWMIATHRGHGFYLARCGYDVRRFMSEMFGLRAGSCKGLGGSMHMSDMDRHYVCSTGVVAGGVPIGVGMALALKYHKENGISVCAFGDGASNQGMALESLNLASMWDVPVLFYCENNRYAVSSPSEKFVANTTVWERAKGFGIRSLCIDGNDLPGVYDAVRDAREYMLSEGKPVLLEVMTYRFNGHSRSDKLLYRTRADEAPFREDDPIYRYLEYLKGQGLMDDNTYVDMVSAVRTQVEDVIDACRKDTDRLSYSEAMSLVYASEEVRI